jgi:hypothetical protein
MNQPAWWTPPGGNGGLGDAASAWGNLGGMGGRFGGSPYNATNPMLPNGNAFPGQGGGGQGNAYGQGLEQRPWQSGILPNGNTFPGQAHGFAPVAAPSEMPAQASANARPMPTPGLMGRRPF